VIGGERRQSQQGAHGHAAGGPDSPAPEQDERRGRIQVARLIVDATT
jgi:hypothetical protein